MIPTNARILQAVSAPKPAAPAPAKSTEPEWTALDLDTLSPELRALHADMREAMAVASAKRKAFEAAMILAIDPLDNEKLIFGYRFGKLSVAIVPATPAKRTASAASLADFMARSR